MMALFLSLFAQILHVGLLVLAAPTLAGVMDWLNARLAGRAGPPILLPWRDLVRLSRKTAAIPESASPVLPYSPAIRLAATLIAAVLVPSFTLGMALAPLADGLVIAGLLALARAAACAGALDTGSAASGLMAQQSCAMAILSEPALLLVVFCLALMSGGFNIDLIVGQQRDGVLTPAGASAIAVTCLLILAYVDASSPVRLDLDLSGIDLAMSRFADWMRRVVWIDLIGSLFLPIGMAGPESGLFGWGVGLLAWVLKLAVAAACLSAVQSLVGPVTPRETPNLIGIAALLAMLAVIMVLSSVGMA
jgi:formate hydrogenlyase subunit 4